MKGTEKDRQVIKKKPKMYNPNSRHGQRLNDNQNVYTCWSWIILHLFVIGCFLLPSYQRPLIEGWSFYHSPSQKLDIYGAMIKTSKTK